MTTYFNCLKRVVIGVVVVCVFGFTAWPAFAQTAETTTGAFSLFLPMVSSEVTEADSMIQAAAAPVELLPNRYVTEQGSDGKQPVTNLHVMDQTGTQNNWDKYVELTTPNVNYRGQRVYGLPANIDRATITALQIKANYLGPVLSYQGWTWSIYDWTNKVWVVIGNNNGALSWQWKLFTFSVTGNPANYVNSSTREIWVRLQSNNAKDNMDLDYEAVLVSAGVTPTPTQMPTATPTATNTPVPPTATSTSTATPLQPTATSTSVGVGTSVVVLPDRYVTEQGSDGGQPVANLHVMDQAGTQNNWDSYLELMVTSLNYRGQRIYVLPANIDPVTITAMQIKANYLGPALSYQGWTWSIYNWSTGVWVVLGNNNGAPSWQWKLFTFSAPGSPANYVNSSSREIWVRLQSNNTNDNMDLDYEAVVVGVGGAVPPAYTPTATATPTHTPTTTPTATNTPTATPTNTPVVSTQAFYVAPIGSNNNPGTIDAPWQTIQHAANRAPAGSTVFVRAGNYAEKVTVNVSGTEGAYITFRNYADEAVSLDGADLSVSGTEGLFNIPNSSYVVVQGFEFKGLKTDSANNVPVAIWVSGTAHHVQIRNNRIHDIKTQVRATGNAHGIAVYGTDANQAIQQIVIDGNEIYSLQLGNSEALVLNGNVDGFEVTNNRLHGLDNIAIDIIGWEGVVVGNNAATDQARNGVIRGNVVYDVSSYGNPAYGNEYAAAGIYVDGGRDVLIEQNTVYNSDYGVELASEHQGKSTSFVTVRNNFIYNNNAVGIGIGGYQADKGRTENCVIVNNTLFNNGVEPTGNIGGLYIQFNVYNNTILNNIIATVGDHHLIYNENPEMAGNTFNYNLYYAPTTNSRHPWVWQGTGYTTLGAYRSGSGNDGNSLFGNPQFVSTSGFNLHLLNSSPAINAGVNGANFGDKDFDGETRVQGAAVDIGADEAGGAGNASGGGSEQFQIFMPTIMGD